MNKPEILTAEEICTACCALDYKDEAQAICIKEGVCWAHEGYYRPAFEKQRDLTSKAKDTEHNSQIKQLFEEIEPIINKLFELINHGDYSNGNEFQGVDEGEVLTRRFIEEIKLEWQQLKEKYVRD